MGTPPVLSHHRSCGSTSGGSVVQGCACALHYLFLTLSVLILYSRFPTYPQISNLIRATAIFKYQIDSVCPFPTVKSFPPSTFIDFFGTTTWTDFCPSEQRFAIRLPSDSTSRWIPLSLTVSFPLSGHFTDLHRLDYAHAGWTKKVLRLSSEDLPRSLFSL